MLTYLDNGVADSVGIFWTILDGNIVGTGLIELELVPDLGGHVNNSALSIVVGDIDGVDPGEVPSFKSRRVLDAKEFIDIFPLATIFADSSLEGG